MGRATDPEDDTPVSRRTERTLPSPDRPTRGDLFAGISVALVLVPQAMAYADLAGLPPQQGLLASAFPPLLAAFFASSRYLQTGPAAMTSLLTLGALSTLAEPETLDYVALAALLALLVGIARLVIGLFRWGTVAYLMSDPVVRGFTSAAATLILASQIPTALAAEAPDGSVLYRAAWTLAHPSSWVIAAALLSAGTVAIILLGRRLHQIFPGVLVAALIGIVLSVTTDIDFGAVVGEIPGRIPLPSLALPWDEVLTLLVPAAVIAVVGFAEAAAISRTYAAADREGWSADQEFVSQGVANVTAGLVGGYPVGGSFARTSVNHMSGARTRWSGAVSGLVVLAFLPFASVISELPNAVLAGIVMAAVLGLVRPVSLVRLWNWSRAQALVAWATFVATLVLAPRVDRAVVLGIALAIGVHLWRELRIDVTSQVEEEILVIRPRGVLWFGSAPKLEQEVVNLLSSHPDAKVVVLNLEGVGRLDFSAMTTLQRLMSEVRTAGADVRYEGVPPNARRIVSKLDGPG